MKRLHRFIHVARIGASATPRISNLGRPNIEMELPPGSLALYVTNLVRTASGEGLRWLARLKEASDWYNVTLLTRVSPALAMVFRSTGFTLPEFTPARLAGAELA